MAAVDEQGAPRILDLRFLGQQGIIAAYLLRARGEAALIDVGPSSTVETLLAALAAAGVPPGDVRHLLLTHIHLDHAGAAGTLLQRLPNARLYVHAAGAPHLIDPTKLIASATRIYGELMDRLWGAIVPVPAERVTLLGDRDRLEVAGRRLEVFYTPGHAGHHLIFRDLSSGEIYAGDAAGVRLQGYSYVRPPTPPPDLDLEAWEASLRLLAELDPPAIYVSHFGRGTGAREHLAELGMRLRQWERLVLEGMRAGQGRQAIIRTLQHIGDEELRAHHADPAAIQGYETASGYAMNVSGYERYLRRRYPDLDRTA